MASVEQLPFRPFSLDTRTVATSENKNKNMEFLTTLLNSWNLSKFDEWLKDLSYEYLLGIDDVFWAGIQADPNIYVNDVDKSKTKKPNEGGIGRIDDIIVLMKERKIKLVEYKDKLQECIEGTYNIRPEELDQMLKFLVNIVNFPMKTATNGSIGDYICKTLGMVLKVLYMHSNLRVGYFFTICAVICDVICSINYVPFIEKYQELNELVEELNSIAVSTNNTAHIHGDDKESKYDLVKYFYRKPKGGYQGTKAKKLKREASEILAAFTSLHFPVASPSIVPVATPPIVDLYAARGQQSRGSSSTVSNQSILQPLAGSSSTAIVPVASPSIVPVATPPIVDLYAARGQQSRGSSSAASASTKIYRKFGMMKALFYKNVMRNKMPLEVFLSYKPLLRSPKEREWFDEEVKFYRKNQPVTTKIDYFELPQSVHFITVKTNDDLQSMINDMNHTEVNCVGIDTENSYFNSTLELIQIATKTSCFLIRKKYIGQLSQELLKQLSTALTGKLVLYFDARNDKEQLAVFIPDIDIMTSYLDLQILVNKLGFKVIMDNGQPKPMASLSDCVMEWMGKPLNKGYTMSDWGTAGELSQEQSVYAVLDAWVLVELFERIQKDPRYTDTIAYAIAQTKILSENIDCIDATH